MAKHHVDDHAQQVAHLREHSTVNASGARSAPKSVYLEMLNMEGVTPEVATAVARADSGVFSAAIEVAAHDLADRVKVAREAGEDATNLASKVSITTITGSIQARVKAQRTYPNRPPGSTEAGPPIVKVGDISVSMDVDKSIPQKLVDSTRELIERALK